MEQLVQKATTYPTASSSQMRVRTPTPPSPPRQRLLPLKTRCATVGDIRGRNSKNNELSGRSRVLAKAQEIIELSDSSDDEERAPQPQRDLKKEDVGKAVAQTQHKLPPGEDGEAKAKIGGSSDGIASITEDLGGEVWENLVDDEGDAVMLEERPHVPPPRQTTALSPKDLGRSVRSILEVFPELDPEYVRELIEVQHSEDPDTCHTVEVIVQYICESLHLAEGERENRAVDKQGRRLGRGEAEAGGKFGDEEAGSGRKEEEGELREADLARGLNGGDDEGVGGVAIANPDDESTGECGCCFAPYPEAEMMGCTNGHLFCSSCLQQYAGLQLATQNSKLQCMDSSGCQELLPIPELRRYLPERLFSHLERLDQHRNLQEAGLDGLEECPFCNYACILDMTIAECPVFQCKNEVDCGVVSCRSCRKQAHNPLTCDEVEGERLKNRRIAIEEAMATAVIRKCPRCDHPFIKQEGCNKMTCPTPGCNTLSCYVCKAPIAGYQHFREQDPLSQCPLWDNVEERHDDEVRVAYQAAIERYGADE